MLIVNANKKIYALLLCTLLIAQPLQSMILDKVYTDAIFYLFFFGGCALLGILTSHLKKIDAKKPNFASPEQTKELNLEISKHDTDLPILFEEIKTKFTEQEKRIEHLEQQCKTLTEQNSQLLITTNNMQRGINGYVPAFVAALWFHKYTEQTKLLESYK